MHKKQSWWKFTIFGAVIVVVLFVWIFVIGISANQHGSFYNKGHNAVWVGHEWVGEMKSDEEVQALINNLKKYQIDTVFVHTGPFLEDGSIDPETYEYAISFVEKANKSDPKIEYQAWLGQVRSRVDLADSEVRHNMAKQAFILTDLVGFDGVHFDIEPVWDEDFDFIEVLKETRELINKEKKISVALAEFIPGGLIWMSEHWFKFENFNSEVNYKNVAKYADQIVVMAYDTGVDYDWLYRWLVAEQTIWLTDLMKDKEVFIGIPAYDDLKEGFNPKIENIKNGLLGVITGLNNIRSNEENFAGVALYPYWEIDDEEWKTYEELFME